MRWSNMERIGEGAWGPSASDRQSTAGPMAAAQAHIAEETLMRQRKDSSMHFGKLLCLGLLVAMCGMVPGVAHARGGIHGDSETFSRQLLHALSLTDDQQAQVREAFGTY